MYSTASYVAFLKLLPANGLCSEYIPHKKNYLLSNTLPTECVCHVGYNIFKCQSSKSSMSYLSWLTLDWKPYREKLTSYLIDKLQTSLFTYNLAPWCSKGSWLKRPILNLYLTIWSAESSPFLLTPPQPLLLMCITSTGLKLTQLFF